VLGTSSNGTVGGDSRYFLCRPSERLPYRYAAAVADRLQYFRHELGPSLKGKTAQPAAAVAGEHQPRHPAGRARRVILHSMRQRNDCW